MKTLDEVIKANDCCDHGEPDSRCEDCPYNGIGACCAEREFDALHYLKAFQGLSKMWNDKLDKEKANPAMTWDELRQMEGKPVWVEGSHGPALSYKGWALISFNRQGDDMKCQLYNSAEFWIGEEDYGTDWQAYRKERK